MTLKKIAIILLLTIFAYNVNAQCKAFARKNLKELNNFVHDGAFNAIQLHSGQTAHIRKTFYKGQYYRIVIAADSDISDIFFKMRDYASRRPLYFNHNPGNKKVWDFKVEMTTTILLSISIPKQKQKETGCVTAIIGYRTSKELANTLK